MRSLRLATGLAALVLLSGCTESTLRPSEPSRAPTPALTVTRIIVGGTPPTVGASSQFTAIAVLPDGSSQTVTSLASWASSSPAVATVTAGGLVTARSTGPVAISATYGTKAGSLSFTVVAAPTYTVSGTIVDATSGGGLAATVTVKDALGGVKSTVATIAGSYSIAGVAGGPAEVTAAEPDHVSAVKSVTIFGDTKLNFSLSRAAACPAVGFDGLGPDGAAFTSYTRCGITVAATLAAWKVSTVYGHPAPYIMFTSPGGQTTIGEILVTAAGAKFKFQSVDVYSSVTPIPYVITGIANSATVFTIQATHGPTLGNFVTVVNPNPTVPVDALLIRLSNPPPAGGTNPMGLDNIVILY